MLPEYRKLFYLKNYLFNIRVEVTSRIKSPDWTEQQLLDVLRKLQNNKSGDHFGLIYELFKPGAIGKDLFKSLLVLSNAIKSQQKIPEFLQYTDITSIFKNKGDRRSLDNDRGIFLYQKFDL